MQDISDAEFDQTVSKTEIVIVDFYGESCAPCKALQPLLEDLEQELGDSITFVKAHLMEAQGNAAKYGIRSVPSLLLFKGGDCIGIRVGMQTKSSLIEFINKELM